MWGVGGGREGRRGWDGCTEGPPMWIIEIQLVLFLSQQIIVQNLRRHRPALHRRQHWMGLLYQLYQLLYHVASLALARYSDLAVSDDDGDD